MSGGRVELGLGAGSFHLARFDHRATGVAFPDWEVRLRRLESVATTLPKLWRGETVDDDELGLRGASLGPLAIEPPRVVIGGASEGAMAVAARHADGWNGSDPDPHAYAPLLERLERACEREGRERPIERQVQLWLRDVGLEHLRERLHAFRDLGVDTAIVVLDGERGAEWVRRIADVALR
jgi:alkanesulfonate monooxygenase SsuD/methylene tetrahydromethanopterin reductase-like flavin-dependent oxidoreductase (luciferase family)